MEGVNRGPRREPGSGILIGLQETNGAPAGLGADLKQLADSNKIPIQTDFSARPDSAELSGASFNACKMGSPRTCHRLAGHARRDN